MAVPGLWSVYSLSAPTPPSPTTGWRWGWDSAVHVAQASQWKVGGGKNGRVLLPAPRSTLPASGEAPAPTLDTRSAGAWRPGSSHPCRWAPPMAASSLTTEASYQHLFPLSPNSSGPWEAASSSSYYSLDDSSLMLVPTPIQSGLRLIGNTWHGFCILPAP